jgi:hypothetical protein
VFIVVENIFSVASLFCSVRIKFSYYDAAAELACLEYTVEKHPQPRRPPFSAHDAHYTVEESSFVKQFSMEGNIRDSGALYEDPVSTEYCTISVANPRPYLRTVPCFAHKRLLKRVTWSHN